MHVCHFCDTTVEGAYFRNIAYGLEARGVKVSLIELGECRPPSWLSDLRSVGYHALSGNARPMYPLIAWRLARLLKRESVDILHTHLFNAGLVAGLAKVFYSKTIYVYMRHHTSVVRMLGSGLHVALDKWMADRADHRVTVSKAAEKYMREVDGIAKPIDVVYLGFDFERFAPNADERRRVRAEFGFGDDDLVVGYVGNFAPGKGHIQLILAFEQIVKANPRSRMLLVGGGDETECRSAVRSLGLDNRVRFAGSRTDVPSCLNAMDIFVQPSLSEAFSQVLIEAMGVGLPVIATDVGGAREVVESGENGFLVRANSSHEIFQNTMMLLENFELRETIGAAARTAVNEQFTIAAMVDGQYKLYKDWLSKRKRKQEK